MSEYKHRCFVLGCTDPVTAWAATPLGMVYSCDEHAKWVADFRNHGEFTPQADAYLRGDKQ